MLFGQKVVAKKVGRWGVGEGGKDGFGGESEGLLEALQGSAKTPTQSDHEAVFSRSWVGQASNAVTLCAVRPNNHMSAA